MVAYHTHEIPTASKAEAEAGVRDDIALSPASIFGATLPIMVAGVLIADVPPATSFNGQLWWHSGNGNLYCRYADGDSEQWVQIAPGGGGGSGGSMSLDTAGGTTGDTGELYRLSLLSNGSVVAIPYAAVPPDTPTGVSAIVKLTSVSLNWAAATGATSYILFRNGVQIGTTGSLTYRDTTTVVGTTYAYTVASVDAYKQRSPASAPVSAFIDPALNSPPQDVVITCWPLPIPTDGPVFIRVNALERDMQKIAYTLGVDAGSLTPTQDPSLWVFRI